MKQQFKKIALIAAMTAALGAVSNSATAGQIFTINETPFQTGGITFDANLISGQYGESVTFGANNTFSTTVIFQATKYSLASPILSNLNGFNGYNLYATLTATGTYTTNGTSTHFDFAPNSGAGLNVFIDADQTTTFSGFDSPTKGSVITSTPTADVLVAKGDITSGGGDLVCTGNGDNCGSFGTKTTFTVLPAGADYFAEPKPFYNMTFSSGDFQGFTPSAGTTQYTSGKLSLNFEANPVPEPETLALFGIGLLGLGLTMRRKQA